ncbi:MAG: transposase [Clostridia bacterium]|nr:transposase [Clostridia bacterium]MDY5555993.1 transposase [Blautia sp.]
MKIPDFRINIINDNVIINNNEKEGKYIARKERVWFPGATYHLMTRGIRRKEIFTDDLDRQVYLELLKSSLRKYRCVLHAYCLMTNHIHMLLETSDVEPGKLMKYLSGCYAVYFNGKYNHQGHLFEGRYKSCLVKDDGYFLQTSRYIHLNPVKAGMAEHPVNYQWSSYRTMIGLADDGITERKKTLAYFPVNSTIRYQEFVEDTGHKYVIQEQEIRKIIGEDDLWLPW